MNLVLFLAATMTVAMDGDSLESSFEDFPSAEEPAPIQAQSRSGGGAHAYDTSSTPAWSSSCMAELLFWFSYGCSCKFEELIPVSFPAKKTPVSVATC
jgi:hypothetical protein